MELDLSGNPDLDWRVVAKDLASLPDWIGAFPLRRDPSHVAVELALHELLRQLRESLFKSREAWRLSARDERELLFWQALIMSNLAMVTTER